VTEICVVRTSNTPDLLRADQGESLAAFKARCELADTPGIFPVEYFTDDRGWSLMNLFQGALVGGQINYTKVYPNITKAWHRHQFQTDCWCVVEGMVKAAIMDDTDPDGIKGINARRWTVCIGDKNPAILVIPPKLWHGMATLGTSDAHLLYYVTQEYDPTNPDEQRQPYDWRWSPWQANHR